MAEAKQRLISGAGGSTSQAIKRASAKAKPKIQDETIGSLQFFELLDLWCEGEIEGFASGAKSGYARDTNEYNRACLKDIYLDGTPVLSPTADVEDQPNDSDFNFADVVARFRWGTQDQDLIPNFAGVQSEISVGVIVREIAPVTRRITDPNVDGVRVSLTWQQAQEFKPDGSIEGVTVNWQIQLSYNGGPFNVASADTIQEERSADPFTLDRTVDLDGAFPVDVRVVRTTADSTDPQVFDEFSWSSYTERQYIRMRYPNSAYCYLKLDSRGFTSVPVRSYRLRLQKIRIPSNGTVDQSNGRISYSGIWDGTFTAAQWCSDPAWALYDLLTSTRYGLGEHIPADALDKWAFYSASVYCNELVSTGVGSGQEPRFSCNVLVQSPTEAYKLINDLSSVMRCMPYWSGGGITLSQDRPTDPTYLFNASNVEGGIFQYRGTSLSQRHTVASVSWLDLESQDIAYEVVEDQAAIDRYGTIVAEVTGFACTSRSQAARLGRMLLATEQRETEVATFTTSLDAGVEVRPGMVISIADPMKSGARQGGRIKGGTTTTVILDVLVSALPVSGSPKITVALPDGTVVTRNVASSTGSTVTLSAALPSAPLIGGPYIYAESLTAWRVLGVREEDRCKYVVTAMTYNATKYAYADTATPMGSTSFPTTVVPPAGALGGDWFELTNVGLDSLLTPLTLGF